MFALHQGLQCAAILEPDTAAAELESPLSLEVVQFAIDDFPCGTDRERKIVVGHLDRRVFECRFVEFLEQQVDETMIDAARRDIADSQDDLFEAVRDGLLHELVEFASATVPASTMRMLMGQISPARTL